MSLPQCERVSSQRCPSGLADWNRRKSQSHTTAGHLAITPRSPTPTHRWIRAESRHGRRRVPIPERLVEELRQQMDGRPASALLFTSPEGERLRNSNWKRWVGWSHAADTIGGGIRFHDLRHTCASTLIQAGATPVEVQRILGHSTPATTLNLYTHLLPDALDGAAAKLDGYLNSRP